MANVVNDRDVTLLSTSPRTVSTSITISADAASFLRSKNNGGITPNSITLTANMTPAEFATPTPTITWYYAVSSAPNTWIALAGSTLTKIILNTDAYVNSLLPGEHLTFRAVAAKTGYRTTEPTYFQVSYTEEIDETPIVMLSRTATNVQADGDGIVTVFDNTGTTITVRRGTTLLTYGASGPNTFSVGTPIIDPVGAVTLDVTPTSGVFDNITAMSSGVESATVYYPVTIRDAQGLNPITIDGIQTFTKARSGAGLPAKMLSISASSLVFFKDSDNAFSTSQVIQLTANVQNVTGAVQWATNPSVTLYTAASGGSITTSGNIVYMRSGNYGTSNTSVLVTASIAAEGVSDTTSIVSVRNGGNSVTVVLGNPSHQLPTDSDGTVTYTGSGTTIRVLEGTTYRNITGVSAVGVGISAGSYVSGTGTSTWTHGQCSGPMVGTNGSVSYTITYTKGDGTSASIVAVQTFVKNVAGTPAKGIILLGSAEFFVQPKETTVLTPASIIFTANRLNITDSINWSTTNGITGTPGTDGNGNPIYTITNTNFGANTSVKVTATAGIYTDSYTVDRIVESADGVTVRLVNDNHQLDADAAGVVYSYAGSGSSLSIYEGSSAITTHDKVAPYLASSYRIGAAATTVDTGTISAGSGSTGIVVNHSGMTANTATITYPVTVVKANNSEVTINVAQTIVKTKRTAAVSISVPNNTFVYDAFGTNPTPSGAQVVTASAANIITPYYRFLINSVEVRAVSSTATYSYTPQASYSNMPQTITVEVYTALTGGTLVASASLAMNASRTGDTGASGKKSIILSIYKWATSASVPTGTSTYTWSTGSLVLGTSVGTTDGWSTAAGSATASGQRLFTVTKTIIVDTTYTGDTTVDWNGAADGNNSAGVLNTIGYREDGSIGAQGANARIAYALYSGNPTLTGGPITRTFNTSYQPYDPYSNARYLPLPNSVVTGTSFAGGTISGNWQITPPVPAEGQAMFQSDGVYDPATGNTVWQTPYLSNLKVGNLSAISAYLGGVKLSTTGSIVTEVTSGGTTKAFGDTNTGIFLGYNTSNYKFEIYKDANTYLQYDGTNLTLKGGTITGGSLTIGSSNTIFKVDTSGNLWSGHATQASAPFQVSNTGALIANNAVITGSIKTAVSGERTEIGSNGITLYDSSGNMKASWGFLETGVMFLESAVGYSGLSVNTTIPGIQPCASFRSTMALASNASDTVSIDNNSTNTSSSTLLVYGIAGNTILSNTTNGISINASNSSTTATKEVVKILNKGLGYGLTVLSDRSVAGAGKAASFTTSGALADQNVVTISNAGTGAALELTGTNAKLKWGSYTYTAPDGTATKFLLANGTWGNLTTPGPIGATTPSTAAFSTISATGAITSTASTGNAITVARPIVSTLTGVAPFTVASTVKVDNLNAAMISGLGTAFSANWWNKIPTISDAGVLEGPLYIDFQSATGNTIDYGARLYLQGGGSLGSGYLRVVQTNGTANVDQTVLAGVDAGVPGTTYSITDTFLPTAFGAGTALKWMKSYLNGSPIYIPYIS